MPCTITKKERADLVRPKITDNRIVDTRALLKQVKDQYKGNSCKKDKEYIAGLPEKMPLTEFWEAMKDRSFQGWVGDTCNICKEWSAQNIDVTSDYSDYTDGTICLKCLRAAVSLLGAKIKS